MVSCGQTILDFPLGWQLFHRSSSAPPITVLCLEQWAWAAVSSVFLFLAEKLRFLKPIYSFRRFVREAITFTFRFRPRPLRCVVSGGSKKRRKCIESVEIEESGGERTNASKCGGGCGVGQHVLRDACYWLCQAMPEMCRGMSRLPCAPAAAAAAAQPYSPSGKFLANSKKPRL